MPETLTPEERAQQVVDSVLYHAEPLPMQNGGGHRLDTQRVYEEVLKALRAAAEAAGKA